MNSTTAIQPQQLRQRIAVFSRVFPPNWHCPIQRISKILRHAAMWILLVAGFASIVTGTCKATQTDDPPSSNQAQTLSLHVINADQQPIPNAVIFVRTALEEQLSLKKTDANGRAVIQQQFAAPVSIEVTADGYRDAALIESGSGEKTLIMSPQTRGKTLSSDGDEISGVWLTSEPIVFDVKGDPIFPKRDAAIPEHDWSDEHGDFQLKSPAQLQNVDSAIRLFAIDRYGRQSYSFLSPADAAKDQQLTLTKSCEIVATCRFNGQQDLDKVRWMVYDQKNRQIGEILPETTNWFNVSIVSLRFELPAGEYSLKAEPVTPPTREFTIPISVPVDKRALVLGPFGDQLEEPEYVNDMIVAERPLVEQLETPIGDWGSVYGRITVDATRPVPAPKLILDSDAAQKAGFSKPVLAEDLLVTRTTGGLKGVFVYLRKPSDTLRIHPDLIELPELAKLNQVNGRFVPHTMIVRTGQKFEFANLDLMEGIFHIYPLKNTPFNLLVPSKANTMIPGFGRFTKAESLPFKIENDKLLWMSAYCLVVDHPYATITDSIGRFDIENLPPGKHEFSFWHERVGYLARSLEVTVEPNKLTEVPFDPISLDVLQPQ